MSGFSKIKVMLGRDLILPQHPDLLRELRSLEFERTEAGNMTIAARAGYHDDLSMALLGAVSCIQPQQQSGRWLLEFAAVSARVYTSRRGVPAQAVAS